jgi:FtsP/CotA-like multicopper oxidase with cupredoxin domain/peroxiredoxin
MKVGAIAALSALICSGLIFQPADAQVLTRSRDEHAEASQPVPLRRDLKAVESESLARVMDSTTSFVTPLLIESANHILSTVLTVDYTKDVKVGNDDVELRSYNNRLCGPTLSIQPGDTLRVRIVNRLQPARANPHFNITNLHTHGLQVSPEDNSDNVFISVNPGAIYDFEIKVPPTHPAGTFWYHAHSHGSTAVQVSSGMAGALLIKGGLDNVSEIHSAKDLLFVFQQFPYDKLPDEPAHPPYHIESIDQIRNWSQYKRETTINGQLQPVIDMAPGEVQRWRFIHAGIAERLSLELEDAKGSPIPFYELAEDGIPLGYLRGTNQIDLGPGYRSEVLVKAPPGGGPILLVDRNSPARRPLQDTKTSSYLMRIELSSQPRDMPLPSDDTLAKVDRPPPIDSTTPVQKRAIVFSGGDSAITAKINGKKFDAGRTDIIAQAGTVEEWSLSTGAPVNDPHPFHIHVNPFFTPVQDPYALDPTKREFYAWKDTLLVQGSDPVLVKMKFDEHLVGKTVLHCHRLNHEDNGMMQVVRINPTVSSPVASNLPMAAPEWRVVDVEGESHSGKDYLSRPLLLVLFRGLGCLHCVDQITLFRENTAALKDLDFQVVLISSDSRPDLKTALENYNQPLPFPLFADERHVVFRAFGCVGPDDTHLQHGLFIIDKSGTLRWRSITEDAFVDMNTILEECKNVEK